MAKKTKTNRIKSMQRDVRKEKNSVMSAAMFVVVVRSASARKGEEKKETNYSGN